MAEIVLRVAGWGRPSVDPFWDPVLGFASPRNLKDRGYNMEHPLRIFDYPYNNYGFMENENTPLSPLPGIHRVAVLGDSHTQCLCPPDESFTNQMEADLNTLAGKRVVEALNGGTGRYSPYQYYVKAKTVIAPLKPEHLVIGIYVGNDLADLTRQDDRPYLHVESDGRITAHPPVSIVHHNTAERSLLDHSRVYTVAKQAVGQTVGYQFSRTELLMHNVTTAGYSSADAAKYLWRVYRLTNISRGLMTQALHQYHWFEQFPNTLPVALKINREVMRLFKELADQNGIRLTYVAIPTKAEIEPEDMPHKWEKITEFDSRLTLKGMVDFDTMYINELKKAGAELGVEVIDLTPDLLKAKRPGARLYYKEDMHLNPEGHRVVGEILSSRFRNYYVPGAGAAESRR